MKKIQLTLIALMMFQFACDPAEDVDPAQSNDLDLIASEFQDMFEGAFSMTESLQLASVVHRNDKSMTVKIEVENIAKASNDFFSDQLNPPDIPNMLYYPAPPLSTALTNDNPMKTVEKLLESSDAFNVPQKVYIKSLTRKITEVDTYSEGFQIVSTFREQVVNASELSEQDKIVLIEIAAGSSALLEFLEDGGINSIGSKLAKLTGSDVPFGRISGCSVNWRSVWLGAVVGFGWGAARGLVLGATTGTVAVPVVGTVTGAISGAVVLGAAGFIAGATTAVAGELIGSCFRSTTFNQTFSSCDQAWEAFIVNQINAMPTECFLVPMGIY